MLDEYLAVLEGTGKSSRSIATRRIQLSKFLAWLKETTESDDPLGITSIDAAKYRKYLQDNNMKPNSVNTALSSIKAFCQWLYEEGKLSHNPVKKVKQVDVVKTAPRGLNKNEKHRLLRVIEHTKNKRDGSIILTMLSTGIRVSELVELIPEDIVLSDRKGVLIVRAGKGNKFRQVPMRKMLRDYMADYMGNIRIKYLGEYLFQGQRDPKLTPRAVQLICKKYGEQAKVDNLTPHILRHTFAHDLLDAGVSLDKVALMLGHASLNTTAIYTRPDMNDLQKAVDQVDYV
ncbi:tyrosine-type recombinase/integrase [Desulfosporosinus sp. FKA]|uniref:tyrosine-type recombinase/integrase n=1 Tax=Desulfosporosinus sp. FKA TaxID=1969834 RepID=UPI000B49A922|nr:tyrosine-type recombinase/integrase [Desulfosporosinus sp. FKA]